MILLFSNIIAPYRIGLYNKLSEYFEDEVKFYFDRENESNRKWQFEISKIKFDYQIGNSPYISVLSNSANKSKLQRFIYFPFYIFPVIFREKPGIILTSEFGLRTLFSLIAGKLVRAKVFVLSEVTSQSESNISLLKSLFRKFLVKFLDGGIAFGRKSFNYLLSLGFEKHNIVISPEAIDNNYFLNLTGNITKQTARTKLGLDPNKFIFTYVGQFIQRKGLDLYAKAIDGLLSQINPKDIIFLFVGGSENEFVKVIGKKPYDNFKIIDYVNTRELVYFYKASDCFVFPTRNDVWGLVVNEAVTCGLPVAVSKHAGCSDDLIEDKRNGLVFDPLDEYSFLETLKFCLEKQKELEEFAVKAKSKLDFFNHETAARIIVNFVINH